MKLLVYDKFWDSFINLPKTTQKKVVDFQKKFRENSKSSSIHLEPISTFKDKTLRSARVDQSYRAIIKSPESGDVYYLLWVDNHDEAYKWASNKVFQWNEVTQSVQMFTAPEITAPEEVKGPAETFFSRIDTEKLLQVGVPEVLLPSIKNIDSHTDLENVEEFIPTDVFENLFYILEGANIDELITEISDGRSREADPDKQVDSVNNQRSFIELTDDSLFNEALSGSLSKWKYYLHPSQRKLVTGNFKGSTKVSGGAGTGKTVAAIHRLKFLSEHRASGEKILFTTYTKALRENLDLLIQGMGIDINNVTINNIDKLGRDLVKEYDLFPEGFKVFEFNSVKTSLEFWEDVMAGELSAFSPEFVEGEYKQVILFNGIDSFDEYAKTSRRGRGKPITRRQRKEIWGFFNKFNEARKNKNLFYRDELFNRLSSHLQKKQISPFDYCLVDEIQDFSNVELRLIRALVAEKENDLFMVGDPMQSIYGKRIVFTHAGINIRGNRSHRLRINYRTTEEIKKLAVSIIEDCHYDNFDGSAEEKAGYVSLFHGLIPTYSIFKTKEEEVETVFKSILDLIMNGYQYSDIAICSRTKDGLKDVRHKLHKQKIPYEENGSDKRNAEISISLLTFHKIKGLEFKHVFLVDVNDRTVPKLPFDFDDMDKDFKENYIRNEKSMVYVAVSRAIENVLVTGIGRKSKVFSI
jgi:hypothetical protein